MRTHRYIGVVTTMVGSLCAVTSLGPMAAAAVPAIAGAVSPAPTVVLADPWLCVGDVTVNVGLCLSDPLPPSL